MSIFFLLVHSSWGGSESNRAPPMSPTFYILSDTRNMGKGSATSRYTHRKESVLNTGTSEVLHKEPCLQSPRGYYHLVRIKGGAQI